MWARSSWTGLLGVAGHTSIAITGIMFLLLARVW